MIPTALDLESVESTLYRSLQALEGHENQLVHDQCRTHEEILYPGYEHGCPIFPEPYPSPKIDAMDLHRFEEDVNPLGLPLEDFSWPGLQFHASPRDVSSLARSDGDCQTLDVSASRWDPFSSHVLLGGGDGRADGLSPYVCMQCSWSCSTSLELEIHAKTARHKTFECMQCHKLYLRRDTLARHAATHKREGLHVCEQCSEVGERKEFIRKDHLVAHVSSRHSPDISMEIHGEFYLWQYSVEVRLCKPLDLSQAEELQGIKIALNAILGHNNPAVELIDQKPDFNQPEKTQLARSLAELALYRPERLTPQTRTRLQRRAS